jgi:very-short-patch-repair endonuclease
LDSQRLFARKLRNEPTDAERKLWQLLRGRQLEGFRFRRQVPIGPYIVDFLCPQLKLVVEIDGGQHVEQVDYDSRRSNYLAAVGYQVVRFWNHDVLLHPELVADEILRIVARIKSTTPPQPSPSAARKGRGQKQRGDPQ